jgi:SAM-dependent methyltransferase
LPALSPLTRIGKRAVEAHDAQFDLPLDDLASIAAQLTDRLHMYQPVLDAGFGSGLMTLPLRHAGLEVLGVDIDVDMVMAALGRDPAFRSRLAFADLSALPFHAERFGAVHVAYVFHLLVDARPVLGELMRVIRPGGRLVINFGGGRQRPPDGIDVAALTRHFVSQLGLDQANQETPRTTTEVPRSVEDFICFLEDRGATRLGDIELTSTVHRSVNYFISRLTDNPFSAPEGVSPEALERAANSTREWAEHRFGDLDEPHLANRSTRYLCWEMSDSSKPGRP